ncbi:MAG: hypothetical protein JSR77_09205 [Planctomycetes bacterium]|nr:hypothetical protein [Planctomycetota bacterium]
MKKLAIDPASPNAKRYADQQAKRKATEKELRRLRLKHFGGVRNTALRQEGLVKLREYTDPALFPLMVRLFQDEQADVRNTLLDIFRDAQSDEGDASLAWIAVHADDAEFRNSALERLHARLHTDKAPPAQVKLVIYEGLRSGKESAMASASKLAHGLNLLEVVPWLINAQVTQRPTTQNVATGSIGSTDSALAWILVGQQTAFVSDLTPVVGPYAVAFDPQLSTVTTGTILRVIDAAVVAYHVDIHNELVDWTTDEFGKTTKQLGYNVPAWRNWYQDEFVPELKRREQEKLAKQAAEAPPK